MLHQGVLTKQMFCRLERQIAVMTKWTISQIIIFFALATLCFAQTGAPAHVHEHHATSADVPSGPTRVSIPDVVVFDQDNRKLHFYSDLIKGKTVAINFIFTTCTTICPPLTANFAKVQKIMQERGENDLTLISVTVDPANDTPEKLKKYGEMFQMKPGWYFVTGTQADMEQIWKAFSIYTNRKEDHPATVVVGNDAGHNWAYASGLTSAGKLAAVIQSVLDDSRAMKTATDNTGKP